MPIDLLEAELLFCDCGLRTNFTDTQNELLKDRRKAVLTALASNDSGALEKASTSLRTFYEAQPSVANGTHPLAALAAYISDMYALSEGHEAFRPELVGLILSAPSFH